MLLVVCCLSLSVVRRVLLAVCYYLLFAVVCSLHVVRCWLLFAGWRSLVFAVCLLLLFVVDVDCGLC